MCCLSISSDAVTGSISRQYRGSTKARMCLIQRLAPRRGERREGSLDFMMIKPSRNEFFRTSFLAT
jgi:hypothetical protein